MLVIGLLGESLSREGSKNISFRPNSSASIGSRSARLSPASASLVFYLIATKDAFISRIFFFNFVPWLYIALLFSHHFLPDFLARGIFRPARRENAPRRLDREGEARCAAGSAARPRWACAPSASFAKNRSIARRTRSRSSAAPIIFGSTIQEQGVTQVIMLEFPQFNERIATSSRPATSSGCACSS